MMRQLVMLLLLRWRSLLLSMKLLFLKTNLLLEHMPHTCPGIMVTFIVSCVIRRESIFANAGNAHPGHVPNVVFGARTVPKTIRNITSAKHAMTLNCTFGERQRQFGVVTAAGDNV